MAHQSERAELDQKKYVDYKDIAYLREFLNPHAKILAKKRTGISSGKQREVSLAIKRARFMALLPYLAA